MISLVGLPGSGKSTVGSRLAAALGMSFIDCDREIEAITGLPISMIFARDGQTGFRRMEAETIDRITSASDGVVATGGGSVLDARSRCILRERSTVVYLSGQPADFAPRLIADASRPLFEGSAPLAKLRQLFAERDSLYRATAHLIVDAGDASSQALAERLARDMKNRWPAQ